MMLLISLCISNIFLLMGMMSPVNSINVSMTVQNSNSKQSNISTQNKIVEDVFSLSVFNTISCNSTGTHIEPVDFVVLAGTNITITCTLDQDNNDGHTSSDIVWYYKSSKRPIPSDQYNVFNATTSQLILRDIRMEQSGSYMCALASDGRNVLAYEGTSVYVGLPPTSPDVSCYSNNILDFWCEWREGRPSNLRTQYTLEYRQQFGGGIWQECPDTKAKGPNSCFISRNHHQGFTQKVRVIATNQLGSAKAEITFNPDMETVPNAPNNVSVESRGPHSLKVTWELPSKWTSYMFLEYKLEYASELEPNNWIQISSRQLNSMIRLRPGFNISNLEPYTNYHVRMSCKSMGVMGDKLWSEWSVVQTGRTDPSVPTAAVTALDWREYSSHEEPRFKRDVFLQWKRLHRHQSRGKITCYKINVMLQSEDGERNVYSENASSTITFVLGLEKYRDYYIQISACDVAGCGPNATIYLPDCTSEPGAPKSVSAQWQTPNSVKVTWEMPSEPNGIVLGYNVQWISNEKDAEWFSSEVNSNHTSYLIKDLDEQTSYQFRVQTRNALGSSGWTLSFELPDENGFFTDEEVTSRSAQQILKQAAQSLRDMMKLLQRTASVIADDNNSSTAI